MGAPSSSSQDDISKIVQGPFFDAKWSCNVCTYHNSCSALACSMCTAPKPPTRMKKGPPKTPVDVQPKNSSSATKITDLDDWVIVNEETAALLNNNNISGRLQPPSKATQAQDSSTSWDCYRCSFGNPDVAGVCEVCEAPKLYPKLPKQEETEQLMKRKLSAPSRLNSVGEASASSGNSWSCPRCTFQNDQSNTSCEVCHSPISGTEMASCSSGGDDIPLSRQHSSNIESLRHSDENKAREVFQNIISFCRAKKINFIDPSFPPADKSVGTLENGMYSGNIVWLRPHDICTKEGPIYPWSLSVDPPVATDIQQGSLGNCWFLSALSVVSERPDLLHNVFVTKEYCPQGVYQIRLNIDGEWRVILVDDSFPCRSNDRYLAFSEGRRNQLWVPLIEKALAKVFGSYSALISGRSIEGLTILTGAPCESISLEDTWNVDLNESSSSIADGSFGTDLTWAKLLSSKEASFLMGASCGAGRKPVDEAVFQAAGLFTKHAYSVLDVRNVGNLRLVQLRNPWGDGVNWTGDFSDHSPLWNEDLRKELMPLGPRQREGVFWMPFNHFYRYFDTVDICKVRAGWEETRLPARFAPSSKSGTLRAIRIMVTEPTEMDLVLYQECHRHSEIFYTGQLDLCIIVGMEGRSEGTFGRYVNSSRRSVTNFVMLNQMMEPGVYIVLCAAFNNWGREQTQKGTLAVHSSKPVFVEEFSAEPVLLADAIIATVIGRGKRHVSSAHCGSGMYYLTDGFGGLVIVGENLTNHQCLHTHCDSSGSENVVSTRGTLNTWDVIPPGHRQILIVLSQLEGSSAYFVMHKLTHRIQERNGLGGWSPDEPTASHRPPLNEDVAGLHIPRPIIMH